MNIFYLSRSFKEAAHFHCDKHVVKMCIEYAQILSTALFLNGYPKEELHYKPTHVHHPCVKWAAQSSIHWLWLWYLGHHLGKEYTKRYKKIHKSSIVLRNLPILDIDEDSWEDPPQAMPDEYKRDDTVEAYRNFYIFDKVRFAKWNYSPKPYWMV